MFLTLGLFTRRESSMGNISVIDWTLRSYTVGSWFTDAGVHTFPFHWLFREDLLD